MANPTPNRLPILRIALPVPLPQLFEYRRAETDLGQFVIPGTRVRVPFGRQSLIGLVIDAVAHASVSETRLKTASPPLDAEALWHPTDFDWLKWLSDYYHHPLGEVLHTALPAALRDGKPLQRQQALAIQRSEQAADYSSQALKRAPKQQALWDWLQTQTLPIAYAELGEHQAAAKALITKGWLELCPMPVKTPLQTTPTTALMANEEQQTAIDQVCAHLQQFRVFLLHGITGSGKTEVYMQIIDRVLQQQRQVLVLLPEITLTPQLEHRFRERFGVPIVSSHSKLTDQQRLNAWLDMRDGHAAIMLGTRSALFTPMQRPGLIVLDEEHDSSFKQQEGFRFSARDAAISRAKAWQIPVMLGSATPSLETLYNAQQGRYHYLPLTQRAGDASTPALQILDIRNQSLQAGLAEPLLQAIRQTLQKGQQVLLFLNRRGFAPVQICHACGWVCRCQHCDANMVIHARDAKLRCHHCGYEQHRFKTCPACQASQLHALGTGTERIEHELTELFPEQHIVRLDRDTTQRKGSLQQYLEQINSGAADIILGTQMLAKGHHFPRVTLVAILDIDSGLFGLDFRASERLAQMITQVAGRAGRAEEAGRVILQTRQPQHPLLNLLIREGYSAFCETLLAERQQAGLPPFSYQALLRVSATSAITAQQFIQAALAALPQNNQNLLEVLGPAPAPMTRRAGQFRFQVLLQARRRVHLHTALKHWLPALSELKIKGKVHWSLDIDPFDLY